MNTPTRIPSTPAPAAEPSSPRRIVVPAPPAPPAFRDLGDTHLAITYAFAPTAAPGAAVDFTAAPAALSAQYARAAAATREIILFGAMLLTVKRALPTHVFDGNPTAPSLKSWLAENCPEIPYNTARAYMNLAAGLVATLELSTVQDALPALLAAPEGTLPDELADDRRRIDEALSGKSARQLEFDFGIRRTPTPGTHGGAREGAGRPSKDAQSTTDPSLLAQESLMEAGKDLAALDRILGPGGGAYLWNMAALKELKSNLLRLADWTEAIIAARAGGGR